MYFITFFSLLIAKTRDSSRFHTFSLVTYAFSLGAFDTAPFRYTKKAGVSSFENTPAHYACFPYSVVYGGSNPSSMPKMADVICEIGGRKIPQKGRCHAALTAWHL
jgi:hypothetical protein